MILSEKSATCRDHALGSQRMTTFDAAVSAAQASVSAPARIARFVGHGEVFWRLLARGAVLLMLTLGIYRFWLTTDIRRYLWSSTEIADESFEYTGTARELLLGFLIAIAVLVPLYGAFFRLALASARPSAVGSCGRALRDRRGCDHPRHRLERTDIGCRRR